MSEDRTYLAKKKYNMVKRELIEILQTDLDPDVGTSESMVAAIESLPQFVEELQKLYRLAWGEK